MSDSAPAAAQLAHELRLVIKNGFADPDSLCPQIPSLLQLEAVLAAAASPDSPYDRLAALRSVVLPDYLARLGDSGEAKALRAMFVLGPGDFRIPTLAELYYEAVDFLPDTTLAAFERRRLPKLLQLAAARFLEYDAGLKRRRAPAQALRAFWGLESSRAVHLIFPELDSQNRLSDAQMPSQRHIRLARFADTDTLVDLRIFLARVLPDVPVKDLTWREATPSHLEGTVINVGGVHYNKLTGPFLDQISSPIRQCASPSGTFDYLEDLRTGKRWGPTLAGDLVIYDYGLFLLARNPHASGQHLTLINGVLTHGVLGACRAFTDPTEAFRNIECIREHCGGATEFAALIRVPVIANSVATPRLYDEDLVAVYPLSQAE